ncbi:MAG TPA: glycine--tRNA ligase [Candidatus Taylorbacteria bacterium]|nr:MAG: glycyl-tRNA synthetase [Parcubacteria group bacterium GW2011_GWA2_47_64]KKU95646.1 MAG: glycyl-tRNA synthetase [Parcubacteria group bacterium GW2011_GWC2_48_17]HBV01134.1 glycine--tRNA ligase [Candidatus Taylorbacteria bacterium]
MVKEENLMEKIVSLCKRRGFVFPGSEIYGGLSGFFDYGHYGLALKENVKRLWWKQFVLDREDMFGMDAAILMRQEVWQASGHAEGFSDPLVECEKCKHRFRADQLDSSRLNLKDPKKVQPLPARLQPDKVILAGNDSSRSGGCPDCGGKLSEARQFNMMFKTHVGAEESDTAVSYLRPETAQGMFANFKNTVDSLHPKLPFGLAQIGKAFRNEIAPRDFLFRTREFEQMEIEYFVRPPKVASRTHVDGTQTNAEQEEWERHFEEFRSETVKFFESVGLPKEDVHELEVPDGERAHYSKRTIDFEFDFPFGRKELSGLAYRTDFDLSAHQKNSGVPFEYLDEELKTKFIPHVIEPSFGVDRLLLAVLSSAYTEDEMNGEKRTFLKLSPKIAPVKVAVFPLLKNKPELVKKAREVYDSLRSTLHATGYTIAWDDNGNIGKRYRRQDEIGSPFCITVDFDSLEKDDVTVRDRDTGKQERVQISELQGYLKKHGNF